ncbi:winged helix-turn-helix domain-containing protein [Roseivirga sp. E12]|uniref:winged helix-turn-helix domain-containing protein n=1 Tax=Roseivirga sp. E12 TaxID=2819237 RepID=UPI001ABD35CB|nr:winged helix-turn-helix domain-containing protein [Roseivirga sp. E12]MBO3697232.1 PD40 domain-containing protein [Roseivirga sp. E12]
MGIKESFKVGDWLVEPELLSISRGTESRKLEFKTMEILICLVANKGQVVSKKKLHDEVWAEVYVTDNALTRGVSKLRKALDDDPLVPKYIETISKSGYRLVAPVSLNYSPTKKLDPSQSTVSSTPSRRWLWLLILILTASTIGLVSSLSRDIYSSYYDPVPVSTLVGPERALSISPDGQKISFSYAEPGSNDADVYIKLLGDLSQIKFTKLTSPQAYGVWSPDGNYMAYVSAENGSCEIFKEPSFGGEKVKIGACFQSPEDLVWSPDGKTIAFSDVKSQYEQRQIFFLDIETQVSAEAVSQKGGIADRDPVFSPDGEQLIFRRTVSGQQRDIYRMDLISGDLTRLTFDDAQILGLDIFDKGRQIAFSSNRTGTWALWRVGIEGGDISRLHINDRVPTEPRFSKKGDRMVYKSLRDQTRIWSIEKNEGGYSEPSQVASSTRAEIHPSLSHDGNKIAFISDRSGHFEIWIKDFRDNNLTKLTSLNGSYISMPSWSADAKYITFDARIDGDHTIYQLDIASKMISPLVDLEGDQVNARPALDGNSLYFASNHNGSWQLWNQPMDSNDEPKAVTKNGGYFMHESPKDGLVYYTKIDTIGIWRVNDQGSEELFIPNLSNVDWGNWIPTEEGIVYIDRSFGLQILLQPYDKELPPVSVFTPEKRIQGASPSLYASPDGQSVFYVQIEQSEDEIMMVDFR